MQKQSKVLAATIRRLTGVESPRGISAGKELARRGCIPYRFRALALATLVMGCAFFGLAGEGSAKSTMERYSVRGPEAHSYFYSNEDCGYMDFYVDASEHWEKSTSGAPTLTNGVYASFYQYSGCGDSYTEAYGSGFMNDAAQLDPKLDSASASVSFDVSIYECTYNGEYYDCTESAVVPFTGTITWTGVGTIYPEKGRYKPAHGNLYAYGALRRSVFFKKLAVKRSKSKF
jgi:hypothetical protein